MGDVGSGFVGFTLGIFALFSIHHGTMTVWTWVILLAVFIADATITVICRYVSGEKWFEGHATHAYQNAARSYKSHSKVTITVILINCIWLAPLAWLSVRQPQVGAYLALIALFPLVLLAIRLKAGKSVEVALLSP
jgi:Fuc2NAc and GlcNAc transferase